MSEREESMVKQGSEGNGSWAKWEGLNKILSLMGCLLLGVGFWLNHTGRTGTAFHVVIAMVVGISFLYVILYSVIKRGKGETSHEERDFF